MRSRTSAVLSWDMASTACASRSDSILDPGKSGFSGDLEEKNNILFLFLFFLGSPPLPT